MNDATCYQSLIGVLRWMVELGRVDICCEVSMMPSCLVLLREGHLQQLFHIFSHSEKHHNTEMVFDPTTTDSDPNMFHKQDWSNTVYALGRDGLKEDVYINLLEPQGQRFTMRVFVDSNRAGDTVTRRSRTGFLFYLQSALINLTHQRNKQ